MTERRAPRSIREIDPSKGLHRLKGDFQKKYMAAQCKQLIERLDEAIDATRLAAPVRTRPYLSDRADFVSTPVGKEAILERALHKQWSGQRTEGISGCWQAIVAFQVNLPNRRVKGEGWGEIDLIGLAEDALPIVIEVKADRSSESPAQVLVQAAAYGIALQKAWPVFGPEWRQKVIVPRLGVGRPVPKQFTPCRLVCAAPEAYWKQWRGFSPRAWDSFANLIDALSERGFPATFVGLEPTYKSSVLSVGHWTPRSPGN